MRMYDPQSPNSESHGATTGPHKIYYTLPGEHRNDTGMNAIPWKYITDARNRKQAVIVDLETFNRMESIIEENGLTQFMEEAEEDETLSMDEAKNHYRSMKKD